MSIVKVEHTTFTYFYLDSAPFGYSYANKTRQAVSLPRFIYVVLTDAEARTIAAGNLQGFANVGNDSICTYITRKARFQSPVTRTK